MSLTERQSKRCIMKDSIPKLETSVSYVEGIARIARGSAAYVPSTLDPCKAKKPSPLATYESRTLKVLNPPKKDQPHEAR